MQKTINIEVKIDLKFSIMVRNADFDCPKGYCSSQNSFTKVQT